MTSPLDTTNLSQVMTWIAERPRERKVVVIDEDGRFVVYEVT